MMAILTFAFMDTWDMAARLKLWSIVILLKGNIGELDVKAFTDAHIHEVNPFHPIPTTLQESMIVNLCYIYIYVFYTVGTA